MIQPAEPQGSIAQQQHLLRTGKISAAESVQAHLDRIDEARDLNVFIKVNRDAALERAREADRRIAAGTARPLEGIPIAVKDNYCTKGVTTTAGSKILQNFVPTYESTVTQKLLDAGAVIIGKANMDEFAMGSSTETSHFGPTINPAGVRLGLADLSPGGSSGGSAAAVAGGFALGALGTDTGGSVRQPASFCGVVGMKPSYGVCSRWGIIAYASSLDQAGVFGKSVEDVAIILSVIAGEDLKDTTSVAGVNFNFLQGLSEPPRKLRIGFPREIMALQSTPDADEVWRSARRAAQQIGADMIDVSIPSIRYALPTYYIVALSEASSNLARYDGVRYGFRAEASRNITELYERTRAEGFGAEVKRRIMLGTYSLSAGYYDAYYLKALKVRNVIANEFAAAFQTVDVMLMPTAPTAAFRIGSHSGDPVQMYLEDVFTVPVNLAGLPAISLPAAKDSRGMPLGLQVVGPRFGDELVIRAAGSIERAVQSEGFDQRG
jgi:aspartyl-tRNA(Asn)/glutamyl-tRNA(Gln) amidotransferase subunit A